MTGINTYKKNRRGGESAKEFYVEPRPSARHSASLMLSSRARRRSQRGPQVRALGWERGICFWRPAPRCLRSVTARPTVARKCSYDKGATRGD